MIKSKKFARSVIGVFVFSHGFLPISVSSNPMSRWDVDVNRAIIDSIRLSEIDINELPQLADGGIKSGEATLNYLDSNQTLIVDQKTARLLAYWNSFNIGENSAVQYNQNANDVALNIIQQQSPSQILGSLKCDAACWLINPNGIIFGENAQVDTRGLIAAAMAFNDLPMSGDLTEDQRERFETESFYYQDVDGRREAMLINAKDIADGVSYSSEEIQNLPRIIVKNGATIKSDGAPVLLAGPEVINAGSVSSESGQVVLAGSRNQVYVALTNPEDKKYRGYLVEVDSGELDGSDRVDGARGAVANLGTLSADFGNVTLVSSDILQAGKIQSKTAVDVNGAVRLIARDRAEIATLDNAPNLANRQALYLNNSEDGTNTTISQNRRPLTNDGNVGNFVVGSEAGKVTMTSNSRIEVAIDQSDTVIAQGSGDDVFQQPRSQINIEGREVVMESNIGDDGKVVTAASIVAPSAELTIRARENTTAQLNADEDSDAFVELQAGSIIDVSGTENTELSADRNTVEFFVTSNELSDAPEQKNGVLLRETVSVDIRKGTSLFDWSVALNNIEKTASERSASGGSIDILAKGRASIDKGTVLDVSGGKINYQEGYIDQTYLQSKNGLVDISNANKQEAYTGVLSSAAPQTVIDPKWGEIQSYRQGPSVRREFREAYFEGVAAGSISIDGPAQIDSDAQFLAGSSLGRYQQEAGSISPDGGTVAISNNSGNGLNGIYIVDQAVSIADQLIQQELQIDKSIIENSGAKKFSLGDSASKELILLEADTDLDLAGTSLDFTGTGIYIFGDIKTSGGNVSLTQTASLPAGTDSLPEDKSGILTLAGEINTTGNWTNFGLSPDSEARIDAGDITVASAGRLEIEGSASFTANAGATISRAGDARIGDAGHITITAKDRNDTASELVVDGPLNISALDAGQGGRLTIEAGNVRIGDFGSSDLSTDLFIDNNFFQETKVGGYHFVALDGNVTVQSDAKIDLSHDNLIFTENFRNITSDSDSSSVFDRTRLPDYLASSGELMLDALRIDENDSSAGILTIEGTNDTGSGAHITGPAGSGIDLLANNKMLIDGAITIAGGDVSASLVQLDGITTSGSVGNYILVGENAEIDLSAAAINLPFVNTVREKRLIDSGNFSLNALLGYALLDENAKVNLSGTVVETTERVFSNDNPNGRIETISTPLRAGDFSVVAEKGFDIAAEIDFGSADKGYEGGTQSYRLAQRNSIQRLNGDKLSEAVDALSTFSELTLILADNKNASTTDPFSSQQATFGDSIEDRFIGKGYINTDNLSDSHTSRLILDTDNSFETAEFERSQISIADTIDISATTSVEINSPNIQFDDDNIRLSIIAPYVKLGELGDGAQNKLLQTTTPTLGTGHLFVATDVLSLTGNLSISGTGINTLDNNGIENIAGIDIRATQGVSVRSSIELDNSVDIISSNAFTTAGDVSILAPILWAETLSDYVFDLTSDESTFQFEHLEGTTAPLLSAAANIGISANQVDINSKIAAPFGSIQIGKRTVDSQGNSNWVEADRITLGDDAIVTVAGTGDVPLGRILATDVVWTHTVNNTATEIDLPEKNIVLSASKIVASPDSQIDLSGGGNIYGREFVAGLGGGEDILANQFYQDSFAILPTHQSGLSPFDPAEFTNSGIPIGTVVDINGSSQIADGKYTVLPANYALLPGAILVTPETAPVTVGAGYRTNNIFGAEVVSGRFTNINSTVNSRWGGFRIEPGSVAYERADYRLTKADDFFIPDQPGTRPEENGRLVLSVTDNLNFEGSIISSTQSPVGVSFDLSSSGDIIVGNQESDSALVVAPGLFDTVNADSLLIGGQREWISGEEGNSGAWQLTPLANKVTIDATEIDAQEIVVTAKNAIELINDSQIKTTDEASFSGNQWITDNNGSTLLSSTTSGSQLLLDNVRAPRGGLLIEEGSGVQSAGAIGVAFNGRVARLSDELSSLENITLQSNTGNSTRLQVATDTMTIGDITNNALLGKSLFESARLIELKANSAVNFIDSTTANLTELIIESAALNVNDNVNVALNVSDSVALIGNVAKDESVISDSNLSSSLNSSLQITAPTLLISNSATKNNVATDNDSPELLPYYLSSNAAAIALQGTENISVSGTTELETAGDLVFTTTQFNTNGIGHLTANTSGSLALQSLNGNVNKDTETHGIFNFIADKDIIINTAVSALSGLINIESKRGSVTLDNNAHLDVSSYSVEFPDEVKTADAGIIAVRAGDNLQVNNSQAFIFGDSEKSGSGGLLELLAANELSIDNTEAGQWSAGGVGLTVQASSIQNGLQDILLLNNNGLNGDVDILVTGDNQSIVLAENDSLVANNLRLASLTGQTQIDGNITVNNATENVVIHGGSGATINDTASLSVTSTDKVSTAIESPNGHVTIADTAALNLQSDLLIVSDNLNDVDITSTEVEGSKTLATVFSVDASNENIAQNNVESWVADAIANLDINNLDGKDFNLIPLLDIYSNSDLTISQALTLTDPTIFYTNPDNDSATDDGLPGILQFRSAGDITIAGGINAATETVTSFLGNTQILLPRDSWGLTFAAGTNTTSNVSYAYTDFLSESGDITLFNNSPVKTGTGDIQLFGNNLELMDNSYIATVGKADVAPLSVGNPSSGIFATLPSGTLLPSWGERAYDELFVIMPDFSGFSLEAGDITIDLMGSLTSTDTSQTPVGFIQRVTNDAFIQPGGLFDAKGIRTWALAVDKIDGGIHSVAGGDVSVSSRGTIDNLGFSTTGLGLDSDFDPDNEIQRLAGGKLNVKSRDNILHSSFANDGSSVNVRAIGAITNAATDTDIAGSSLLIGSNTDINLEAGTGLTFDSVLNTFSLPAGTPKTLVPGASAASFFIDGFDTTHLSLTTVNGDLVRNATAEGVNSFIPNMIANDNDGRLSLLPHQVTMTALAGDIVLATAKNDELGNSIGNKLISLAPSDQSNLVIAAANNITSNDISNNVGEVIVTMPDVLSDSIPNIQTDFTQTTTSEADLLTSLESLSLFEHSEELIGRNGSGVVGIYALTGDIGSQNNKLQFALPKEVKAIAGNNIINTTFDIQHGQSGSISQITAGQDISYPLAFTGGALENVPTEGIKVAGPGDLIVTAGGNIDIGSTGGASNEDTPSYGGITSIGNLQNSALPSTGANIHVFAGFNQQGDYGALIGEGIASNQSIAALSSLNIQGSALADLSFIDWFAAQAEVTSNAQITETMISNVSRATGKSYTTLDDAIDDWWSLSATLQSRIAVSSMKEIALANPQFLVDKGDILFVNPELGDAGFASQTERQQTFKAYWNGVGSLAALEYLLTPDREADLLSGLNSSGLNNTNTDNNSEDLSSFVTNSIADQLNTTISILNPADTSGVDADNIARQSQLQLLAAEKIMLDHTKQSGIEGFAEGNTLVNFERGFIAQRLFFGEDYDAAILGLVDKAQQSDVDFGIRDGSTLTNVEQIFQAWNNNIEQVLTAGTEGKDFTVNPAAELSGDISLVFSSIASRAGGDINIMTPSGSVDVGLAKAQLTALGVDKPDSDLGIITLGLGDINGIVANNFNVNQSRTFSLAGGELSLWSSFGDIDAGRGAKTAFSLPEPEFRIDSNTGAVTTIRPPAVAGSGIRTSPSRSLTNEELTNEQRFYQLAEGAGAIFLSTPVGIVDAGEAGIQSAGDLFIAAAEVRGADNISVGGVSVGVATDTSVDVNVANVGSTANAATDAAQSGVTDAASDSGNDSATAFITIELLDTGT